MFKTSVRVLLALLKIPEFFLENSKGERGNVQFQTLLTKLLGDRDRLAADTNPEIRESMFRHCNTNSDMISMSLWTEMMI